jgi:hypothetical protein
MKAFKVSNRKQFDRLASSFSLRRSAPNFRGRRAQSNRYPDLGFKPYSAFPHGKHAVALELVAVTVAQPSRIHTGFPDIGPQQWRKLSRLFQRAEPFYTRAGLFQENFVNNPAILIIVTILSMKPQFCKKFVKSY